MSGVLVYWHFSHPLKQVTLTPCCVTEPAPHLLLTSIFQSRSFAGGWIPQKKSGWSIWITAHVGVFLLQNHTAPVCMIWMPPNAVIAFIPASKLKPRGLSRTTRTSTVAKFTLSVQILTLLTPQHAWILPVIVRTSMCFPVHNQHCSALTIN